MRKRTSDKELAKRAKNLVKKWKNQVGARQTPINGQRLASQSIPAHIHHPNKPSSPMNRISRPSTPHSASSVFSHSSSNQEGIQLSTPPSPAIGSSKHSPSLPVRSNHHGHIESITAPRKSEILSKTNAANKKRRRNESPACTPKKNCIENICDVSGTQVNGALSQCTQDGGSGVHKENCITENKSYNKCVVNNDNRNIQTDADRLKAAIKTQKVRTTAQLIEDLSSKSGVKLSNSEAATKIALNQIEKEQDPVFASVLPPGARPKARRNKTGNVQHPPIVQGSLSQTKSELVKKFLETSMTPISHEMTPDLKDQEESDEDFTYNSSSPQPNTTASPLLDSTTHTEHFTSSNTDLWDDPWALLPPLNHDEIDWSSHNYTVTEPPEVVDGVIDRLHNEHWEGVNGQSDSTTTFRDWTETYSVPKPDGESLHILPYV